MLELVPLGAAHLTDMARILHDPLILRFTLIPDPPPPDFAETWLARYEQGRRDGTREAFAAIGPDGAFLGLALAPRIDREGREMELGYLVAPEARGRGVAVAILRRLSDWAFAQGALRLELIIDATNGASRRVAERAGYVHEGTMRSKAFKQGARADTELWSRLPGDPVSDT